MPVEGGGPDPRRFRAHSAGLGPESESETTRTGTSHGGIAPLDHWHWHHDCSAGLRVGDDSESIMFLGRKESKYSSSSFARLPDSLRA